MSLRCAITGAAHGIGRALAIRWARSGASVVAIDCDTLALSDLQATNPAIRVVAADLSSPKDQSDLIMALEAMGRVDCFIHNAGINRAHPFEDFEPDMASKILEVNLLAPMLLTQALLEQNLIHDGGSFIFLCSLSCFVGYPGAAVYGASKDGLSSFARSLAVELRPRRIHVLRVFPGPTRTRQARENSPDNRREAQRMDPAILADRIFKANEQRRRVLIPGFNNWLMALLGFCFPRLADAAMRAVIFDRLTNAHTKS